MFKLSTLTAQIDGGGRRKVRTQLGSQNGLREGAALSPER